MQLTKPTNHEKFRVRNGLQCPECFGVNTASNGKCGPYLRFHCTDCGCQWDCNYYPAQ